METGNSGEFFESDNDDRNDKGSSEKNQDYETGDSERDIERKSNWNPRNNEAEENKIRKRRRDIETEWDVKFSKSQLLEALESGKFRHGTEFKREEIRDALLHHGMLGFDARNLGFHRLWAERKRKNWAVRDMLYDVPIAKEDLTEDEKEEMSEQDLEHYFDVPVNGTLLGQTDIEIFSLSNLYRHALSGQSIRLASGLVLPKPVIDQIFRLGKLCFDQTSRQIWKGRCQFCLSDLKFEEADIGIRSGLYYILGEIFNDPELFFRSQLYSIPVIAVKRLCASTDSEDIICYIVSNRASESKSVDHTSSVAQYLLQRAWERGVLLSDSEYDDIRFCDIRRTRPRYSVDCLNPEYDSPLYIVLNPSTICEQINRLANL